MTDNLDMKGLHQLSDPPKSDPAFDFKTWWAEHRDTYFTQPLQPYQRQLLPTVDNTYRPTYDRYYWYHDPLTQLRVERDLDAWAVIDRLVRQRTALLTANLPLDDYALKITRAEAYALHRYGYLPEVEVATFYGICLVQAE